MIFETAPGRRPDVYFEVPADLGDALRLRGDPFLLAALVPAMEAGERRIHVEGEVDPVLLDGVEGAGRILRTWSPAFRMPTIEASGGFTPPAEVVPSRVASTLAGGIDSLFTLRRNRLEVPAAHPASIRDALFVFGFNTYDFLGDGTPDPARLADHAARLARWQPLARSVGLRILPVHTNMRTLVDTFPVWARRAMGAALAAVAHALGGRITHFRIPSAGRVDPLCEDGTHPALDPLYSGASLQVAHDGLGQSRLQKLRLLADWPEAMAILQPCQQVVLQDEAINCGTCNKCRRTMLELEALGRMDAATSFPPIEVDAAFVHTMKIAQAFDFEYLTELVPLFEARGRGDLVAALRERRRAWERAEHVGVFRRLRRRLRS